MPSVARNPMSGSCSAGLVTTTARSRHSVQSASAHTGHPASVLPSLAGERRHNPELSELIDPILRQRRRPLVSALERAQKRGELAAELDLDLAADLIVGPIAVRLFFTGRRIQPKLVEPLVALALEGVRRSGRAGA
jgi:hypothetical protein